MVVRAIAIGGTLCVFIDVATRVVGQRRDRQSDETIQWICANGDIGLLREIQNYDRNVRRMGFSNEFLSVGRVWTPITSISNTPQLNYDLCFVVNVTPIRMFASVVVAIALIRNIASKPRAVAGGCPACGYDLRATPDRCPECGALAPADARSAKAFEPSADASLGLDVREPESVETRK